MLLSAGVFEVRVVGSSGAGVAGDLWVLRTEPKSFVRAVYDLNHGASLGPNNNNILI